MRRRVDHAHHDSCAHSVQQVRYIASDNTRDHLLRTLIAWERGQSWPGSAGSVVAWERRQFGRSPGFESERPFEPSEDIMQAISQQSDGHIKLYKYQDKFI
jgi:hypothetical protein